MTFQCLPRVRTKNWMYKLEAWNKLFLFISIIKRTFWCYTFSSTHIQGSKTAWLDQTTPNCLPRVVCMHHGRHDRTWDTAHSPAEISRMHVTCFRLRNNSAHRHIEFDISFDKQWNGDSVQYLHWVSTEINTDNVKLVSQIKLVKRKCLARMESTQYSLCNAKHYPPNNNLSGENNLLQLTASKALYLLAHWKILQRLSFRVQRNWNWFSLILALFHILFYSVPDGILYEIFAPNFNHTFRT